MRCSARRSAYSGRLQSSWVLASRNEGKLIELRALFATQGIDAIDLREARVTEDVSAEEAIESFATFEENALAKARYFSARLPGRIVVADDSGLSVDALGGAPGVRSKRWAVRDDLHGPALDTANNALLVATMRGRLVRTARFVCAAFNAPPRSLLLAGDDEPAPVAEVVRFVCSLFGLPQPASSEGSDVPLSLRGDRSVDCRATRSAFGIELAYPSYREGYRSILAAWPLRTRG